MYLPPMVLLGTKGDQKPAERREWCAGEGRSVQGPLYVELGTPAT